MSERCTNCGLELFAGQQFCRRCGAAVRPQAGDDERPTRILEGGTAGARQGSNEMRGGVGGAGTDPFGEARQTAAQEPFRVFAQTAPLAPAAPRGGRWWTLPFIVIVALACVGVLFMRRESSPSRMTVAKKGGLAKTGSLVPPIPPIPPELPEEARAAIERAGVPTPFDESGATVTDDRTVFTKTVQLGEDLAFSIPEAIGEVRIEGWDGDEAEIKVTKRGGTAEQRRAMPVMLARGDERVSLLSPPARASGGAVRVSYEIKLPRSLRQLELTAEEAEVELKNLDGAVSLDVRAGSIELKDVTGTVRSKLIKGSTKVVFGEGTHDGAQEFSVVRGNVEVDFAERASTDVKAETMDGDISADEDLGLRLVKSPAGIHALGRIGEGREPMLIKVVNGDIKLKK
ncbi:MAG TPA: DUF4097 family beta strand repeat-containing protein [Pyrinomonadaceae bacterium]|nr:DUF4097 family beta strand repeat-containing protein [Pyrinomonadaceae bacterium]